MAHGLYSGLGNVLLNTLGKRILICGEISDSLVIIDADSSAYVFSISSSEDSLTVLQNLVISGAENGVIVTDASPKFTSVTFRENIGRGIWFTGQCQSKIRNCKFESNEWVGIGLEPSGHELEILQSDFRYNKLGGILSSAWWGSIHINKCVFDSNGTAVKSWGAQIDSTLFVRNTLAIDGGVWLNDCIITDGVDGLRTESGIGMFGYEMYVRRCTISNMSGTAIGGGNYVRLDSVYIHQNAGRTIDATGFGLDSPNTLIFNDCKISDNTGTFAVRDFVNLWLNRCEYSRNQSAIEYQKVFPGEQSLRIDGCTILGNTDNGITVPQMWGNGSINYVRNSIISGNTGFGIEVLGGEPEWLTISCNNIFQNLLGPFNGLPTPDSGLGNFSSNPLFCDTASGDYRIKDSSPCAPANNSCGVLIGAYGIGCANIAPELTSSSSATVIKRTPFVYHATSTDIDGPNAIYSFASLPVWMSSAGDSAFGTPALNDSDTDIIAIVSDGFLADSMIVHVALIETPLVGTMLVDGSSNPLHLISNAPKTEWSYLDPTGLYPQTSFEIAVSTDNDWQFAEMWNPAPFATADTSVVYNGAPLLDGQTYWLRLRVSNSLGWSNWSELMFRMNSVPTSPQLRLPLNNSIVSSQFPNLTIRNPIDAENDSMLLTIEISADSFATSWQVFEISPDSDSLTTVAVPVPLDENTRYWWRLKSSDYYEASGYSPIWSFWINSSNTAPSAFSLLNPPNTLSPTLADNTPEFTWQSSFDLDPGDSVKFTLQLSIDSSFSFASQIPGLTDPHYIPTNPLEWGRRYWWRVKAEDKATAITWSNEVFSFTIMKLGDPDGSGVVTISDVVFIINFIFASGQAPNPLASADADCNGLVTISDAVYLIQFIFAGGPPPCEF